MSRVSMLVEREEIDLGEDFKVIRSRIRSRTVHMSTFESNNVPLVVTEEEEKRDIGCVLPLLFQREFENNFQETAEATFAKENE